jgi:glycosyltransferase involved in cell wall biosynthesis
MVSEGSPETVGVAVVIPAHNESAVLPACLDDVIAQDFCGPLHIVVVANGCTDDTAALARCRAAAAEARGFRLDVIELERSGKPAALNAGDSLCPFGIRIFLDADVELSPNAVSALVARLDPICGMQLCAPRLRVAPPRNSLTRSYARLWGRLPYVSQRVIGCGIYAVTSAGRARWGAFPDIISDDKFARLHFSDAEQCIAAEAWYRIHFPERFGELLAIRGRWCRGNDEVATRFPHLLVNDEARYRAAIGFVLSHPLLWRDAPIAAFVYLAGRWIAFRARGVGTRRWERSSSSRVPNRGRADSLIVAGPAGGSGDERDGPPPIS